MKHTSHKKTSIIKCGDLPDTVSLRGISADMERLRGNPRLRSPFGFAKGKPRPN